VTLSFGFRAWPLDTAAQLLWHWHAELLAHVAHHVEGKLAVS